MVEITVGSTMILVIGKAKCPTPSLILNRISCSMKTGK